MSVDPYLPTHGDPGYHVEQYDLSIEYRPEGNRLDGRASIDVVALDDIDTLAFDLAHLSVDKVTVDGRRAKKYTHRRGKLVITLARPLAEGESALVAITYSGKPKPVRGPWGDVGWDELSEGAIVAGQPDGAPSWFPCNDRPGDKARYRIAVTTDSPFTVVANGEPAGKRARAGTTTWTYEQPDPMATYLATVQIGAYEIRDLARKPVRQRVARSAQLRDPVGRDLARQDDMMTCFVETFGPYPFGSYTVVVTDDDLEIPLEAQGVSIFGANHLAGHGEQERLVAHELAHQWFGNSLTVARWSDIWLNEGFACYAEWLWSEYAGHESATKLAHRYWKRLRDSPQDLLLRDPGPDLMFDDRLYKRGALTLHALRGQLGDRVFFDMLRGWVAEHRHGTVDTAAFSAHVAGAGGRAATAVLTEWIGAVELPPRP